MASLARAAVRLTARNARGFQTSSRALAAQNFTMPALSPTMTEGNIASWRVKEGDKFAAGDVLLEIETDKATMDVEAQEDGFLMKIMQGDGSKSVKVGSRIAVLAEDGDDISTLEIPADNTPEKASSSSEAPAKTQESAPETPPQAKPEAPTSAPEKGASSARPRKQQSYPLYPSVAHLAKENNLDDAAIAKITPTGPNGRLLKGDVLAYLGKIDANAPVEGSSRFNHLSHLDLSNIKISIAPVRAPPAEAPATQKPAKKQEDSVVTLPVSLAAVIEVQRKVDSSIGVFLPLSEFISRAADVANEGLPLPAGYQPSADELFNQVLGLDKAGAQGSRGRYLPQIAALPPASLVAPPRPLAKQPDVLDFLAAPRRAPVAQPKPRLVSGVSTGPNVFSLRVPKSEERRAEVFLERVKLILEKEPGRLVL